MVELLITPKIGLIFWQTIVLIFAYFVLRKMAWHPILSFIETQEKAYSSSVIKIEEAEKVVEKAEKKCEIILKTAEAKRETLIAKAMATQKALIEETQIKSEKIHQDMLKKADQQIKRDRKNALQDFKAQAGTLVVETAQKLIGRELAKEHVHHMVLQHMIDEVLVEKKKEKVQ